MTNITSPFIRPASSYRRDLDPLNHYIEDVATFLSLRTGKSLEQCTAYVKKEIGEGGKFQLRDPRVLYLERQENGDRVKKTGTLTQYLYEAIKSDSLIAPTFTIYHPMKRQKSYLVDFIEGNIKKRGIAKKAMFKAEMEGNKLEYAQKKAEQNNKKTSNNSISGGHAQSNTPLHNKTAHSTLTSTCRNTSGYGNANNEKMLSGNRHYWSPHIVRNNIIAIINLADLDDIRQTMEQYDMRHPTVDETMACIRYSTDLYWWSDKQMADIRLLVETLSDVQRSAFVYIGDLYHIAKYNDSVVREMLDYFCTVPTQPLDDAHAYMKTIPEEYFNLAKLLTPEITKGKQSKEIEASADFGLVAACAKNIDVNMQRYAKFFNTFFMTKVVPASLAMFPDSVRRAALTSDTDSTIFTVQDWCQWHRGRMNVDKETNTTSDVMVFLASQSIVHLLARMSANFGVEESRIFKIAMKNEFKFDVFIPTQLGKHYFALISSQEGNVFKKHKNEIKGVHLKSSNAPKKIIKRATKMMEEIMYSTIEGKKLSLMQYVKEVADIERSVRIAVEKGSYEYFRITQIKQEATYTKPGMESNYWHYLFWQEVFAPKYGVASPPPYTAVKISIGLNSPTKLKAWMDKFEDRDLAARMEAFMKKSNRDKLTTVWLPEQLISMVGIPPELLSQVDVRKIIYDTTSTFYIILEVLGMYMETSKNNKLVSDLY